MDANPYGGALLVYVSRRRRRAIATWTAVAALVVVAAVLVVLYARGGGPLPPQLRFLRPAAPDPLARSTSAETALRTLRLAGFDRAVVGESAAQVVVRVAVPQVRDAATVEMSWQTALAAGALAYPDAETVVAQLFANEVPLLEVSASADVVRAAAREDDPAAVRADAHFKYLAASGGSE